MCRCGPGASHCLRSLSSSIPSFCLFSVSLLWSYSLMAGQHLFSLPRIPQDNGELGNLPTCLPKGLGPGLEARLPLQLQLVPAWLFLYWIFSTCQTWDF